MNTTDKTFIRYGRPVTIVSAIDDEIGRWMRISESANQFNWSADHTEHVRNDIERSLDSLESLLPSGSGIDCGTKIDREACKPNKVVLNCEFHHMNDNGMYDGWTGHRVTIVPTFHGFEIKIGGRNRNGIKNYLTDVYGHALDAMVRKCFNRVEDLIWYENTI